MKINENLGKSMKINENLRKSKKIHENLEKLKPKKFASVTPRGSVLKRTRPFPQSSYDASENPK